MCVLIDIQHFTMYVLIYYFSISDAQIIDTSTAFEQPFCQPYLSLVAQTSCVHDPFLELAIGNVDFSAICVF